MKDAELLSLIKRGESSGLEAAIDRYTPYVAAVVKNQLGSFSAPEDVEELVADAFLALWRSAGSIRGEGLKGWLGAVARNSARSRLRSMHEPTVSEEDVLLVSGDNAALLAEEKERRRYILETLSSLGDTDREIFLRYYYYDQTVAAVAEALGMNLSTVKTRLARGRTKLREQLKKGGYDLEI